MRFFVSALTWLLLSGAVEAQVFGDRVDVRSAPVELEPNRISVGAWGDVQSGLQAYLERPRSDDDAVIAEIQALGDSAPPPYLMEMGRRLYDIDPVEGSYWWRLGLLRTQWDAFACSDSTAMQGVQVVLLMFHAADNEIVAAYDQPSVRAPAFERLGNADAVFMSRASAWWVCSHGMGAITAAVAGEGQLPLSRWRLPDSAVQARRDRLMALLPQWLADDRAALARG